MTSLLRQRGKVILLIGDFHFSSSPLSISSSIVRSSMERRVFLSQRSRSSEPTKNSKGDVSGWASRGQDVLQLARSLSVNAQAIGSRAEQSAHAKRESMTTYTRRALRSCRCSWTGKCVATSLYYPAEHHGEGPTDVMTTVIIIIIIMIIASFVIPTSQSSSTPSSTTYHHQYHHHY